MDNSILINGLMTSLLEAEYRRLNLVITDLNKLNKQLRHTLVDGFLFRGALYIPSNVSLMINPSDFKTTLHESLNAEMEAYVRDRKTITDDKNMIHQMLFRLLKPCRDAQDIRSALPECLVSLVQGLSRYNRVDNPGYTLRGDLRAMRQFAKITPKMEFYSTTKLLY